MKTIELTQGKVAIVDDDVFDYLSQWNWFYHKGYAARHTRRSGKSITIWMHRVILNTPNDFDTDHINGNSLDNRLENLRVCTMSQNQANRGKNSNNTSGYKGVCWSKSNKNWIAFIRINGKRKHLGSFSNIIDAADAYEKAAQKIFGKYARS